MCRSTSPACRPACDIGRGEESERRGPAREDQTGRVMLARRNEPYVAQGDRLVSGPFVVVTLAAFAFFLYIGMLVPIVPLFIEGPLDAGELGIGVNVAVFATAAILARPTISRIADRRGRRFVIVVGATFAGIGGALSGQGRMRLDGSELTAQVDLVDFELAGLSEALGGVVTGSATVAGSAKAPRFAARLSVPQLRLQKRSQGRLEIRGEGDLKEARATVERKSTAKPGSSGSSRSRTANGW